MTMWIPPSLSPRGPVYLAIADALAGDIRTGRLNPGQRLPTHRALAQELGVNVVTVSRAYAEAARRGLVDGEVGRGTFVRSPSPVSSRSFPVAPSEDDAIDFSFNTPASPPNRLAQPELFDALKEVAEAQFTQPYLPAGQAEHREAGARWIARSGVDADPDRVIVTNGGQHAMAVAFSTLARPGDTLLTEELTYPGAKALTGWLQLRTNPVAMDDEGVLPESLEYACRKTNARLFYTTPTIHNPVGCVLSEERRQAVVEVARRFDLFIIEDDTTGFLLEEHPTPFVELAPERAVYLCSTSKSLTPGLRIGYLQAPKKRSLRDRFIASQAALVWMAPGLMAEIATRWIQSGLADELVTWKRDEARARRAMLERILPGMQSPSHPLSSFIWLPLPEPWRSEAFVEEARQRGVALTAPESFVVGRAPAPHAVRLCIGTPRDRGAVERGLEILQQILTREPGVCRALV